MRRRWNISLWIGFAIVVFALVSYQFIFAVFPVTRDVPWANYLLFLAGGVFLFIGLKRAFGDPEHYRGRVSGAILGALSLLMAGLFVIGILYLGKQIPSSPNALREGQPAPSFALSDTDAKQVVLADLLHNRRAALLIFYRGYW